MPWPEVFMIQLMAKYLWENFRSILKNCENHESLAQQIFPDLRYYHMAPDFRKTKFL